MGSSSHLVHLKRMRLLLEPGDLPPFLLDLPCSVTDFKLVALLQRFDLAQLVAVVVLRRARALLCYLLVRADFGKAKLQLAHLGLVMLILSLLLLVLLFNRLGLHRADTESHPSFLSLRSASGVHVHTSSAHTRDSRWKHPATCGPGRSALYACASVRVVSL
eukprot:4578123-Pleurochrysis_carterae.AAC.2